MKKLEAVGLNLTVIALQFWTIGWLSDECEG